MEPEVYPIYGFAYNKAKAAEGEEQGADTGGGVNP